MVAFTCICFLLLCVQATDAGLDIIVEPKQMTVGETRALTVNCTYFYTSLSAFHVSSLVIDAIDNSTKIEVASINIYSGGVVSNLDHEDFMSWGHLDPSGVSYLAVKWNYPSTAEARMYECEAYGLDTTGHPENFISRKAEVTYTPVDVMSLTEMVRKFQSRTDGLEKENALLANNVTTLQETVKLRNQQDALFNQSLLILQEEMQSLTQMVTSGNCSCSDSSATPSTISPKTTASNSSPETLYLLNSFLSSSYYISSERYINFSESSRVCSEHGGYLVKIDSKTEMDMLVSALIKSNVFHDGFLTGAKLQSSGDEWIYESDGSKMDFEDWDNGEPDQEENECMAIFDRPGWKMIDFPCQNVRNNVQEFYDVVFFCEMP